METIFYLGKNDLLTFSFSQLRLLAKHNLDVDIKNLDKNTIAWLLAIKLLSSHHVSATMAPAQLWNKYKVSLMPKLKKDIKTNLDESLQLFISADPSANKKYLQWIIESYINDGIKKVEDLNSRVKPALEDFIILLNKKVLKKGTTKWENETNIYNYCGLVGCKKGKFTQSGLEDLLSNYAEILKKIHQQKEQKIKGREEGKLIFETEELKIIQPLTEEAACYYGQGTRWCTAATLAENVFKDYNEQGPLYILLPSEAKYPEEKYQLHFETKSFMNEKDEPIGILYLIERFPDLKNWDKVKNIERQERFKKAVEDGDVDTVKLLLGDERVDPAADNSSAIRISSLNGHADIVKLLLTDGRADPSALDNSAIRLSSQNGHTDVVRSLLANPRVDPTAGDSYAIVWSSQNGHTDVVRLLLDDGRVNPSAKDNVAIRASSNNGHAGVVKLLLADGRADPAADKNATIVESSEKGHTEVVKSLLMDGRADPTVYYNYAIRMSSKYGHTDVVRLLLADPRVDPTTMYNAAIKQAMEEGHTEIVELLLQDPRVKIKREEIE